MDVMTITFPPQSMPRDLAYFIDAISSEIRALRALKADLEAEQSARRARVAEIPISVEDNLRV